MVARAKLTIMLVDDDDMMRAYLRVMLRAADITGIEEVGNAEKALKILQHKRIDLIFLDINLPDMDGIAFIQSIKAQQPDCQIIMVSGEATKERVQQAITAGAKDFIAKPFNATIVETKVNHLVAELAV